MTRYPILVTGCPRSGTKYMSEFLISCGHRVTHEKMGKDGISAWSMAFNGVTPQWCNLDRSNYEFDHVIHVVRNPVGVISSIAHADGQGLAVMVKHLGLDKPDKSGSERNIIQAARAWCKWNGIVDCSSSFVLRVEDAEEAIPAWLERVGMKCVDAKRPGKNVNTRSHPHLSWEKISEIIGDELSGQVKDKAMQYGYDLPAKRIHAKP